MSAARPLVISLRGVGKAFDGKRVLAGLDLEVRRGETVVVLGGSGSGKSVLLKHINGLLQADEGEVVVLGCNLATLDERDLIAVRRRVSYVFQQGALFDSLNVGENVAFPLLEHTQLSRTEVRAKVASLLERVGLAGSERLAPAELSGGMRKRVALARGLALEPEVMLYDEPTAGLDPLIGVAITKLIEDVARTTGATSLVVTHDLGVARELGGRVAFLLDGRFVFEGSLMEAAREGGGVGAFVRAGGVHA